MKPKTITQDELFALVCKDNGLRGRQKITGWWMDGTDEWVFDSNATGGYGETLTFHYGTADLVRNIAPEYSGIKYNNDGTFTLS